MKERIFISQPMKGKTSEEIIETRNKAIIALENEYNVVNNFLNHWDAPDSKFPDIYNLAKGLELMSTCDCVYFCRDWMAHRGCKIEHEVATNYGMKIIYE